MYLRFAEWVIMLVKLIEKLFKSSERALNLGLLSNLNINLIRCYVIIVECPHCEKYFSNPNFVSIKCDFDLYCTVSSGKLSITVFYHLPAERSIECSLSHFRLIRVRPIKEGRFCFKRQLFLHMLSQSDL